ncbi:5-(carboxyamino)imidazole ribonucleotide synthase [Fictibacillus sp. 7GRE50]|uniref:5-(carboxyamino)imidazole ribonucleotide synthase n=1 Tax=unclassified Fictibacillus TaxID=2644029 RepID=UPI0018CCDE57|nr:MULTISPECIES: 5-(carboxyamino)imidazole ribonucleotide synthase [unclassified Fictibacillus]MBH0167118.1 5-(carboxyamino)imidazole ribonucleotide synthase [Fictibacillus sp. 7GRE50]MBH0174785.1 5-(carboxyamino)imidazole ribonucleotide synthase [Fictibacillus sp. 23RED33]
MFKTIRPQQTLGILGGGQLGRMMALSAREMGLNVVVLEPGENSPCGQVADQQITTAYDDREGIKKLAEQSDVVTYEFENIDAESANWLEENGNLPQGSRLLSVTQHRLKEKETLQKAGVPVAPYRPVTDLRSLQRAVEELGYPSVLKTCRGGYDGKGQFVIKQESDLEIAATLLEKETDCVLEAWIPFEKEISVIVTRSVSGEVKSFPIAENIHKENILHQTIAPARITNTTADQAKLLAGSIATELELVGTLAVEMFVAKDGTIYVNELAPRPHNSGHYTIEACETSQFDQHVRAVCNWPLGNTELIKPAVMINILGEHHETVLREIGNLGEAKLHLYGKKEAKAKRKMGHITVLGDTIEQALEKAEKVSALFLSDNKTEVTQ